MDSGLVTEIVAFLTAALTLYQEVRHRRGKPKKVTTKDLFPPKVPK